MTYVQKIIKEAKDNGKKIDNNIVMGLRAVEKMHNITKECKGSPSRLLEESRRYR